MSDHKHYVNADNGYLPGQWSRFLTTYWTGKPEVHFVVDSFIDGKPHCFNFGPLSFDQLEAMRDQITEILSGNESVNTYGDDNERGKS